MSADPRLSLAELRKPCGPDERITQEAIDILCDIAEAAQAVAQAATFYADDDTPDGSLIVVPREEMKALDNALGLAPFRSTK